MSFLSPLVCLVVFFLFFFLFISSFSPNRHRSGFSLSVSSQVSVKGRFCRKSFRTLCCYPFWSHFAGFEVVICSRNFHLEFVIFVWALEQYSFQNCSFLSCNLQSNTEYMFQTVKYELKWCSYFIIWVPMKGFISQSKKEQKKTTDIHWIEHDFLVQLEWMRLPILIDFTWT